MESNQFGLAHMPELIRGSALWYTSAYCLKYAMTTEPGRSQPLRGGAFDDGWGPGRGKWELVTIGKVKEGGFFLLCEVERNALRHSHERARILRVLNTKLRGKDS
jgi:hypothetical protein